MLQKKKLLSRRSLSVPATLLWTVVLSVCITVMTVAMQPNGFRNMLGRFWASPGLALLNYLPVLLLLVFFAFLFRNVFAGGALTALLLGAGSLASRVKTETRYEALFPRDVLLLREVGNSLEHYNIDFPWKLQLILLAVVAGLVVLAVLFSGKGERKMGFRRRLLGCGVSLGLLLGLTVTVYASDNLYYSFPVSNLYDHITVYYEYGFPYSFLHNATAFSVEKPEGYSTRQARQWDEAETGAEDETYDGVHVIMVMNEAFSDLTDYEAFCYTEEDPLENFHRLQQTPNSVSGHIVVANIGGGTANTEFDVLTGMQTDALSPTTTLAFGAVGRNIDSLYRVFRQEGYDTSFIHPSVGWFYNRENTYEKMGVEYQIYDEEMTDPEYKGPWITDNYLAEVIEERYRQVSGEGKYMFTYVTTFQNHMSYTTDKYGEDYVYPELETTASLTPETESLLEVYVEGIRDADAMLGRLTDYFAEQNEPVVLVFFGDHLPSLGAGNVAYQELGIDLSPELGEGEDFFYPYATPYLMWTNEAGAEALDWETRAQELELPENGYISACYLGSTLLEMTGRGQVSSWYANLNELRRTLPVIRGGVGMLADGTLETELSPELQSAVEQWRQWTYYKMKHKEIP